MAKTIDDQTPQNNKNLDFAKGERERIHRLLRTDPDLVSDSTKIVLTELDGYLEGTPGPKAYDVFSGKACFLMGSCHMLRAGSSGLDDVVATCCADILLEKAQGYRLLAQSAISDIPRERS